MARSHFGMGFEIRRRERIQITAETVDSRANLWLVEQAKKVFEGLRRVMRNIGSDDLCGDDSFDGGSIGLLNDFSDTLLELEIFPPQTI